MRLHFTPKSEGSGQTIRTCGYYVFSEDDSDTGYWSQEGCTFIRSNDSTILDTCQCDHLTHFGELLIPRPVFSEQNENILEIISVTGCVLSMLGLILIGVTAAVFPSWRENFRNQIWLRLCVALSLLCLIFIIIVFSRFDGHSIFCMLTGIILHYSVLASFCWMVVIAVKSYRDLVIVFVIPVRRKMLIASSFAWGVPALIVVILLIIDPRTYAFEDEYARSFCYPSGISMWITVYLPIAVMLLTNWISFLLIVRKIGFAPRNLRYQRAGDRSEALKSARVSVVLVFLFGLPWIFGLFAYNIVAVYFFTCTATTQGFVLFLFIICGNQPTRNLWVRKFRPRNQRPTHAVTGRRPTVFASF